MLCSPSLPTHSAPQPMLSLLLQLLLLCSSSSCVTTTTAYLTTRVIPFKPAFSALSSRRTFHHHRETNDHHCALRWSYTDAPQTLRSNIIDHHNSYRRLTTLLASAAASSSNTLEDDEATATQSSINNINNGDDNDVGSSFQLLIKKAVQTLVMSDTDGEELEHSTGSASQGLWLHAPSAKDMQSALDRVVLTQHQLRRIKDFIQCHEIDYPSIMIGLLLFLQKIFFLSIKGRNYDGVILNESKSRAIIRKVLKDKHNNNISENSNNDIGYTNHHTKNGTNSHTDDENNDDSQHEEDDVITIPTSQQPRQDDDEGFDTLIQKALQTLIQSDIQKPDGSSTQGRWVYDPAAMELRNVMDRLVIPQNFIDSATTTTSLQNNEQCKQWLQWMKSSPKPLFLDLTSHIHEMITQNHHDETEQQQTPWLTKGHLKYIDMSLDQYISRIACHVILLPSGSDTGKNSLVESTGSHIYGQLLYGGVSRFRLLKSGNTVRRAGERREVMAPGKERRQSQHPSWVQLGGLERKYEAIDMGPAAILELTLLPRGWQDLPNVFKKSIITGGSCGDMTMSNTAFGWDPSAMLQLLPKRDNSTDEVGSEDSSDNENDVFQSLEGKQRNDALTSHFKTRVGGLQPQIDAIVRRVLDGRSIYASNGSNDTNAMNRARIEAEALSLLGLQPVRGLLLYGRPGVGKTLIVREIARALSSRPPKIVAASELLDRWVGGSERLVRELFQDAENELKMCQQITAGTEDEDKAYLNSALHVIVIDEIDAVFRKRTDSSDSGSATRDSVVNQLLAKLDGVSQLPNTLMIGMTNRRELLDPALLRPGRLEVQIEIPLPGQSQRREILQIHFGALRARNRLSYPLRCAIDGAASSSGGESPDKAHSSRGRKRRALRQAANSVVGLMSTGTPTIFDLAVATEGYSGADIAGLERCAGSRALSRARKDGSGVESLLITLDDAKEAMDEIKV